MGENKSTRDLCIETNAILKAYIKDSTLRREICGKTFDDKEARLRVLEDAAAQAKGGWKVLLAVTTAAGAVGGLLVKFLHFKP